MKGKGKLEIEDGSLIYSKVGRWTIFVNQLRDAFLSIEGMRNAKTQIEYQNSFNHFVNNIETAYTSFYHTLKELTSKASPRMREIENFRKSDDLLQYFKKARDVSQHKVLKLIQTDTRTQLGKGFSGLLHEVKIYGDGSYEWDGLDYSGANEFKIVQTGGQLKMPSIVNRGVQYVAPTTHLGLSVSGELPHELAERVYCFYRDRLLQLKKEFEDNK